MLFKEIIAVHYDNYMKPTYALCEQNEVLLFVKTGGTYIYHWSFMVKLQV
jgi:hypothetical protein